MIEAIIHHKEEIGEDILTSIVFGLLKYKELKEVLISFVGNAKNYRRESWIPDQVRNDKKVAEMAELPPNGVADVGRRGGPPHLRFLPLMVLTFDPNISKKIEGCGITGNCIGRRCISIDREELGSNLL